MAKEKKSVYVKLDPDVVREVDVYAARNDLYRNEAMERLLRQAVSHGGGTEHKDGAKFD